MSEHPIRIEKLPHKKVRLFWYEKFLCELSNSEAEILAINLFNILREGKEGEGGDEDE